MKKYCFQCGARLDFSVKNKPKFCSNCGDVLEPSLVAENQSLIVDNDDDHDEPTFSINHLNIDKLDFEFDKGSLEVSKQTIGSVMGSLDKSEISQASDFPKRPKISSEEFKKEFEKEAGSLKRDVQTEENASQ